MHDDELDFSELEDVGYHNQHQKTYYVEQLDKYDADHPSIMFEHHAPAGEHAHMVTTLEATDLEVPDPDNGKPPLVVSSECSCGPPPGHEPGVVTHHHITLDVDMEAYAPPSSTDGHVHLYVPHLSLTWDQYADFMDACLRVGLISPAYFEYSMQRRCTAVRLPWVKKKPGRDESKAPF